MEALRIVLADDHALFREGTRGLLERDEELQVVGEARTGQEAVELATRLSPDVIIVDVEMPDMDGIEATRRIKLDHPRIAVLALTVHDEEQLVLAILEAGAAGYLLKDVHSAQLVRAVKALHAGESVLHPAITARLLDRMRAHDSGVASEPTPPAVTDEQQTILRLAAGGSTNQEIAEELGLAIRTVQLRMTQLFDLLGVASRTEAVVEGLRRGVISLDSVP